MNARERFDVMVRFHVEQPLNVHHRILGLISRLPGDQTRTLEKLKRPEVWRAFMPPLYNFLMTCLEVFLEQNFLENYRCPDGRTYCSKDEWLADIHAFRDAHDWPRGFPLNLKTPRMSFQNLRTTSELYAVALGKPLSTNPRWRLMKLMFAKRHLFTHRGGLVDRKFVDEYNEFHQGDGVPLLDESAVGQMAFLERDWVRDSVREVRAFVDAIK